MSTIEQEIKDATMNTKDASNLCLVSTTVTRIGKVIGAIKGIRPGLAEELKAITKEVNKFGLALANSWNEKQNLMYLLNNARQKSAEQEKQLREQLAKTETELQLVKLQLLKERNSNKELKKQVINNKASYKVKLSEAYKMGVNSVRTDSNEDCGECRELMKQLIESNNKVIELVVENKGAIAARAAMESGDITNACSCTDADLIEFYEQHDFNLFKYKQELEEALGIKYHGARARLKQLGVWQSR